MPSFLSLVVFLATIPLSSAAAVRTATRVLYQADSIDSSYSWSIGSWTAGCRNDVCTYAFNVSGPYSGGSMPVPAFSAYCAGEGVGVPYRFCQLNDVANSTGRRQVAARLMAPTSVTPAANTTSTGDAATASLVVSFQFDDMNSEGTWWNYTSYIMQEYGQKLSFSVRPSEVYGVA